MNDAPVELKERSYKLKCTRNSEKEVPRAPLLQSCLNNVYYISFIRTIFWPSSSKDATDY